MERIHVDVCRKFIYFLYLILIKFSTSFVRQRYKNYYYKNQLSPVKITLKWYCIAAEGSVGKT